MVIHPVVGGDDPVEGKVDTVYEKWGRSANVQQSWIYSDRITRGPSTHVSRHTWSSSSTCRTDRTPLLKTDTPESVLPGVRRVGDRSRVLTLWTGLNSVPGCFPPPSTQGSIHSTQNH